MSSKCSEDKFAKLKDFTESEDGITLTYELGEDGKKFFESLLNSEETDEPDEMREDIDSLICSLISLATTLSVSLDFMIDDGYSMSAFVPQKELLCKILDFFKSIAHDE